MSKFDLVRQMYEDVPYMRHSQAKILRDLFREEGVRDVIEVGFFSGKSSAYIAGILEDQGAGSLTTLDLEKSRDRTPNIEELLRGAGLAHRVTPIYCFRSYTWELQRLISLPEKPKFDFCYFDGGHAWDQTALGVLLIDMLLRPGGLLLLDDMNWSVAGSTALKKRPKVIARYSKDEAETQTVRRVWELVLPHLGYEYVKEYKDPEWGLARKPG